MKKYSFLTMTFLSAIVAVPLVAQDANKETAAKTEEAQSVALSQEQQNALMEMFQKPATKEQIEKAFYFIPDVLVQIGNDKLTRDKIIEPMLKRNVPAYVLTSTTDDQLREEIKKAADAWIEKMTLLNLAKKAGFAPSEELAKKELQKSLKTLKEDEVEQIKEELKKQDMTIDSYFEKIAKDSDMQEKVSIQAYLESTVIADAKKKITDKEISAFYNENKKLFEKPAMMETAHILIACESTGDEKKDAELDKAAKEKIDAIAKDLKKDPAKFGAIAKEKSDCPSGKSSEGKLPPFAQDGSMEEGGAMIPDFAAAAFKLEKDGQIGDPIKTSYGYHIIKRISKTEATTVALDKVKDQIQDYLVSQIYTKALDELIEKSVKDVQAKKFDLLPKSEEVKKAEAAAKEEAEKAQKAAEAAAKEAEKDEKK